ncbi:MAG TPA: hypothetical protein EYP85_03655 [Armatimonadetes bacterium]|nr:hypothetical protein [Armatimonadota bacterium]
MPADYLRGSLTLSACREEEIETWGPRGLEWYRYLWWRHYEVPFALVLDLGLLLQWGEQFRFRSTWAREGEPVRRREVQETYEERVLHRLLNDPVWARLQSLTQDSPTADAVIGRALEILLEPVATRLTVRFHLPDLPPGVDFAADFAAAALSFAQTLRACLGDPRWVAAQQQRGSDHALLPAEAVATWAAEPDPLLRQWEELTDLLQTWVRPAEMFQEEDFFELEHLSWFPNERVRAAGRLLKAVERHLGPPSLPRSVRPRTLALAETPLESLGTYPTGGFAEIAHHGVWENLVPSELVYLKEGETVDPFTLRLVEGELLFYLRDAAVLRLLRRTFTFGLDLHPTFRAPIPNLSSSDPLRGVEVHRILLGLVLTLVEDLRQVFRRDSVQFEVALLTEEPSEEWSGEREALYALLRAPAEQQIVRVTVRSDTPATLLTQTATGRPDWWATVVLFSTPERLSALLPLGKTAKRAVTVVPVAVLRPPTALRGNGFLAFRAGADALSNLRQLREELLRRLIAPSARV